MKTKSGLALIRHSPLLGGSLGAVAKDSDSITFVFSFAGSRARLENSLPVGPPHLIVKFFSGLEVGKLCAKHAMRLDSTNRHSGEGCMHWLGPLRRGRFLHLYVPRLIDIG